MMLTLLESARPHPWLREGVVISVLAHTALIAAAGVATRPLTPAERAEVQEQVRFLIPLDRVIAERDHPRQHAMRWLTNTLGGGNGGMVARAVERQSPVEADAAGLGPDDG